jgi:hypothetical protein
VLQEWDFAMRPVSVPAAIFLRENYAQPLFSAALDLSPTARARAAKSLEPVTAARRRASLLRDYVVQCPNFPNSRCSEEERAAVVTLATRGHLLADDDSLSLEDLAQVQTGELLKFLHTTAAPWAEHVLQKCLLCHEKGHCCEICGSEERLYPWDGRRITACKHCGAITHMRCMQGAVGNACRRCERIRRVRGDAQRRLSEGSSGGYSSGHGSIGGRGYSSSSLSGGVGLGAGGWGSAAGGGADVDGEWEEDEDRIERDLALLLPVTSFKRGLD